MGFYALDLLAYVGFEIVEGVEVGGGAERGAHFFGQRFLQFVFLHPHQAAIGVVDDDEFLGVEQVVGDDQGADRVLGGDASGVADHVGVAGLQAEAAFEEDAGVHASEDSHVAAGANGEISQIEASYKFFVGF